MPTTGKEIEQRPNFDQIAVREVDNYIEKIEKQAESSAQVQQQAPQPSPPPQQPQQDADMGKVVAAQFAVTSRPKIVLPLNQNEIEGGLKRTVVDGVRWLAEWCVMMIKKYPGRVFYLPPSPQT